MGYHRSHPKSDMIIADTPEAVERYRLLILKHSLKLEIAGLKRRGPSAYSLIKQEFKLKGSKQKVLNQLCRIIEGEYYA